jgi:hypothetical protein
VELTPGPTTTPSAGLNISTTWATGNGSIGGVAPGAAWTNNVAFAAGAASLSLVVAPGAALAASVAWAPGSASITGGTAPGALLALGTAWQPGGAQGIAPGAAWSVSAVWVGGAGSVPGTDPTFSSVSLLLPFEGANNSTTFTDASSNALTPSSVTGDVKISTAQLKYGSASALFTPGFNGGFIRYTPQALLQFSADFTIEAWVYSTSTTDQIIGSSASDQNTQIFRLNAGRTGTLSFYLNGASVFDATNANITANTWQHLAICRSGTSTRMFVNGFQIGPTNTTWTGTFRMDVIGTFFFDGSRYEYPASDFTGHIDELRLTKAARYTSNFTPAGPHPTS